ncbi:Bgt-51858 [Blumeria graminis f. sp. tritici]|uniref:Bgt-51858 n=1 Tax=Blumeria graminis f. sp. tritici TaxID=62690 RepID=A0A9X9PQK6_BLUGR|nr:Bgt-51858 [Blumeria graminis f. sp. tritici]
MYIDLAVVTPSPSVVNLSSFPHLVITNHHVEL